VSIGQGHVFIQMQFCDEGSLKDVMRIREKCSDIAYLWKLIQDITKGLDFIHSRNIIHRDIKPVGSQLIAFQDNILVHMGTAKLADFGISATVAGRPINMTYGRGTSRYMAPEVPIENNYTNKIDIYRCLIFS